MPNLSNFSLKQIILLSGFIFVLISIPISFTLLKNTQVFKSRANFEPKKTLQATGSGKLKEIPNSSPLEDLRKLLESSTGNLGDSATKSSTPPTPTPPTTTASFGQTLGFKIAIEGRSKDQSAKVFIGVADGATKVKPTYLLTFSVDVPAPGSFSGISLAGLTVGQLYTAYLKGPSQIDSAVSFNMSATESQLNQGGAISLTSGDINEDNTITQADYDLVVKAYGATSKSSNWNSRADVNGDGIVNYYDLGLVSKNLGKTGASGVWQSTPSASGSAELSPSSTGGYWMWVP